MNAQEIISSGLLEQYALGACTANEATQVEQWLQQYPEVKDELTAIEISLENYAIANATVPNASVKESLFAKINNQDAEQTTIAASNTTQQTKVIGIKPYWKWAAAASIVLLVGSAISNLIIFNKYQQTNKDLAVVKNELAAVANANTGMKEDMTVMNTGIPVSLSGLQTLPDAKAKIYWIKNNGDVYIDATTLPAAPVGKQYQFWGIVDGKPVDGGMIYNTNDRKQIRLQKMKSFGKAEAFAVSLEKVGGNPTPTDVVSMGKVI